MRLKHHRDIEWEDLPNIESPLFAYADIEDCYFNENVSSRVVQGIDEILGRDFHQGHGNRRNPQGLALLRSQLENGDVFVVYQTDDPFDPLIHWCPATDESEHGSWVTAPLLGEPYLESALEELIDQAYINQYADSAGSDIDEGSGLVPREKPPEGTNIYGGPAQTPSAMAPQAAPLPQSTALQSAKPTPQKAPLRDTGTLVDEAEAILSGVWEDVKDIADTPLTPLFHTQVNPQTDIVRTFGTIDTGFIGSNFLLGLGASVTNAGGTMLNGFMNGASLPMQGYAAARDLSLQDAENELMALAASTGPAAPLMMTGAKLGAIPSQVARGLSKVADVVPDKEPILFGQKRIGPNLVMIRSFLIQAVNQLMRL